jgi:hypothetical protein
MAGEQDSCTWRPGTPSADVEGRNLAGNTPSATWAGPTNERRPSPPSAGLPSQCFTPGIRVTTPIPVRPVETRSCGRSPSRWLAFCLGWNRTFLFQARPKLSCAAIPTNTLTTQAAGQLCDGACIESEKNHSPHYPRSGARSGRCSSMACEIANSGDPKHPRQTRTPRGRMSEVERLDAANSFPFLSGGCARGSDRQTLWN